MVGPSGLSYAIFKSKRQKPLVVVAKGEKVSDAGVLSEILADRALVDANGRLLTFYMPQNKPPAGAAKGAPLPILRHLHADRRGRMAWLTRRRFPMS